MYKSNTQYESGTHCWISQRLFSPAPSQWLLISLWVSMDTAARGIKHVSQAEQISAFSLLAHGTWWGADIWPKLAQLESLRTYAWNLETWTKVLPFSVMVMYVDEKPWTSVAILALSLRLSQQSAEQSQEDCRKIEPNLDGIVNLWIKLCQEPALHLDFSFCEPTISCLKLI